MVRAFAHKCTGMELRATNMEEVERFVYWDEAEVSKVYDHPSLGFCFIGSFVCGIGAIDCHFPLNHVRTCTQEERDVIKRTRYGLGNAIYSYTDDEIADVTQLYTLPIVSKL